MISTSGKVGLLSALVGTDIALYTYKACHILCYLEIQPNTVQVLYSG